MVPLILGVGVQTFLTGLALPQKAVLIGTPSSLMRRQILRGARLSVDEMLKLKKIDSATASDTRKKIALLMRQVKSGWSSADELKTLRDVSTFMAKSVATIGKNWLTRVIDDIGKATGPAAHVAA